MTRLLQIAQLGHPVLRQQTAEVEDVTERSVRELIDDMMTTVVDADGVGIAAPQVYRSERIMILASRPNARYPDAPMMEPTAAINPEILWRSEQMEKGWEGCLSIPGVRGLVPRSVSVGVRYRTRDGESLEREYEGFLARVFQHEVDHLDGIVFFDRLESTKDIFMEKEYRKLLNG